MIIGGIQKNSMIDYPGKVSCVLFLAGCNFRCPYCHNPELAKGCKGECPCLKENTVYDFLEKRRGLLDGVVISGGEPTLQRDDLIQVCQNIKQMNYPVKLDTNGSRPEVIKTLIEKGLVDYIAMDIKTAPLSYSPLIKKDCNPEKILSSIFIIMESGLPYEFKTTCIRPLVSKQIVQNICQIIQGARLYALQQFQNTGVLNPDFFTEDNYQYDNDELMYLKSVASPWVQECIVR